MMGLQGDCISSRVDTLRFVCKPPDSTVGIALDLMRYPKLKAWEIAVYRFNPPVNCGGKKADLAFSHHKCRAVTRHQHTLTDRELSRLPSAVGAMSVLGIRKEDNL